MNSRVFIRLASYCCLLFGLIPALVSAETPKSDAFLARLQDVIDAMPDAHSGLFVPPTDPELREWTTIITLFQARSYDTCKTLLAKYNYELTQVHDALSGNMYDVISERLPVRRGWGTYFYNANFKKRVSVHVTHPVDDGNAALVAAELFRRIQAQWLFLAGTNKNAGPDGSSDIAKTRRSIFQRWSEELTDESRITLSVHGYHSASFSEPMSSTDIVLSNGRTSDNQWGISQLSLAFRDSVSAAGFRCALAMYDSGCARLAAAGSPQGLWTNDNTGFGHWLNLELSERVRFTSAQYLKFIGATDRALAFASRKTSSPSNKSFSLVSPRVVRIDSLRRMLFPPAHGDSYRIISFNASKTSSDSAQVIFGGWLNFGDGQTVSRVVVDTFAGDFARQLRVVRRKTASQVSRIIEGTRPAYPPDERLASAVFADSNAADDSPVPEPIQVHRIPLQAVLVSTMTAETYAPASTAFKWEGIVSDQFVPGIKSFKMRSGIAQEYQGIPSFLIPLIRSSYDNDAKHFVGVQMTNLLVNEIARLVNESHVNADEVGLYAEESADGDFYLRIFPNADAGQAIVQNTP